MVSYVKKGPAAQVTLGATGGATTMIPNHGISLVVATSSEIYTLAPPEFGVEKTIIFSVSSSTGITPTVRGSTAQTVTFSGGTLGGNTALPTMFKLAATRSTNQNVVVSLVGVSSVSWAVRSIHPYTTFSAAGINGSVTFSTT
jgi:hypothetical protein